MLLTLRATFGVQIRSLRICAWPKETEPKKRPPDIALFPKIKLVLWRSRKLATLKHSTTSSIKLIEFSEAIKRGRGMTSPELGANPQSPFVLASSTGLSG